MLLYLYVTSTREWVAGGPYNLISVTTPDLLSVKGFIALSAIHKELLCHIRYPHGEMAYPIDIEHPYPLSAWIFHRYLSSSIMPKVKLLL